ncbi:hypothetical protein FIBSPDRAFT_847919 [Athelia psychrophila]|uniref:Uncharacterized protein n=1 Tax=Athelia psychrophila TaxID=1759441 RepID=A0A166W174_9AGAM|nr:hypothetical protein FIBSPDRAFT_847919 [Fibularhizoctonia sp. CBS 109695]
MKSFSAVLALALATISVAVAAPASKERSIDGTYTHVDWKFRECFVDEAYTDANWKAEERATIDAASTPNSMGVEAWEPCGDIETLFASAQINAINSKIEKYRGSGFQRNSGFV